MSTVRVIARIRPLLAKEEESEVIVKVKEDGQALTIPNPKNEKENFTFPFAVVMDQETTQAQIFSEGTWAGLIVCHARDVQSCSNGWQKWRGANHLTSNEMPPVVEDCTGTVWVRGRGKARIYSGVCRTHSNCYSWLSLYQRLT